MKFFFAHEARNHIKANWTPETDSKDLRNDERLYLWEVFPKLPVDGLLVSYHPINARASRRHRELVEDKGLHEAIRFDGPIFADCGAFSYVKEDLPPYSGEKLLKIYKSYGVNLAATVDHLIVGPVRTNPEKRKFRYDLTLRNAADMYRNWRRHYKNDFELVGVAQGWSPETYADAVAKLVSEIGFSYVGLGSLAGAPSPFVAAVLRAVSQRLRDSGADAKLHVFGVSPSRHSKPDLLPVFEQTGVSSFDTSMMLRQAWSRATDSYLINGRAYTAIRIPSNLELDVANSVLERLRLFAAGRIDLDAAMRTLEPVETRDPRFWLPKYRQTLSDQPWAECNCTICKQIGVDVLVFRGNERNMRRGFHNVYSFYENLFSKSPTQATLF